MIMKFAKSTLATVLLVALAASNHESKHGSAGVVQAFSSSSSPTTTAGRSLALSATLMDSATQKSSSQEEESIQVESPDAGTLIIEFPQGGSPFKQGGGGGAFSFGGGKKQKEKTRAQLLTIGRAEWKLQEEGDASGGGIFSLNKKSSAGDPILVARGNTRDLQGSSARLLKTATNDGGKYKLVLEAGPQQGVLELGSGCSVSELQSLIPMIANHLERVQPNGKRNSSSSSSSAAAPRATLPVPQPTTTAPAAAVPSRTPTPRTYTPPRNMNNNNGPPPMPMANASSQRRTATGPSPLAAVPKAKQQGSAAAAKSPYEGVAPGAYSPSRRTLGIPPPSSPSYNGNAQSYAPQYPAPQQQQKPQQPMMPRAPPANDWAAPSGPAASTMSYGRPSYPIAPDRPGLTEESRRAASKGRPSYAVNNGVGRPSYAIHTGGRPSIPVGVAGRPTISVQSQDQVFQNNWANQASPPNAYGANARRQAPAQQQQSLDDGSMTKTWTAPTGQSFTINALNYALQEAFRGTPQTTKRGPLNELVGTVGIDNTNNVLMIPTTNPNHRTLQFGAGMNRMELETALREIREALSKIKFNL